MNIKPIEQYEDEYDQRALKLTEKQLEETKEMMALQITEHALEKAKKEYKKYTFETS